jgi:predicted nucleotidyltransferase
MLSALLERVAGALDSRGIPYMVIGGQAVLVYGEPRMTRDIDVTLGLGTESLNRIEEVASSLGLKILPSSHAQFVRDRMVLPCADPDTGFRVDFIFSFTPFERQAIDRARSVRVGLTDVRFASPEDLIIHKMVAGRPRDEEDVRGILLETAGIDLGYIEKWLADFSEALNRPVLARFHSLRNSTLDAAGAVPDGS